jgi:hypothetical protein
MGKNEPYMAVFLVEAEGAGNRITLMMLKVVCFKFLRKEAEMPIWRPKETGKQCRHSQIWNT